MRKKIRRMIAVLLLIMVLVVIGYFVYTRNQINNYPNDVMDFQGHIFDGNDDTMVVFNKAGVWYYSKEETLSLMEIICYEDGVLTIANKNEVRRFVVINKDMMYDAEEKSILMRR